MKKFLIILVVFIVGVVVAYKIAYPSTIVRYKMTVEIETPEGLKTGSAVREISIKAEPQILPEMKAMSIRVVKGEAVVIDLGKRGVVYALIHGRKASGGTIITYSFPPPSTESSSFVAFYKKLKNAKRVLSPELYPTFVYFRDPKDPTTVVNLLDMEASDNWPPVYSINNDHFEEAFGEGVRLKSVMIEMTDEKVQLTNIKENLPYGEKSGFGEWYKKLPYGDPRRLGPEAFYKI